MIQRYLFTAIKAGVDAAIADPDLYDNLFQEQYELDDDEMTAIRTYLAANPVTIAHGYARMQDDFPRVCLIMAEDNESDPYLGDEEAIIDDEEDEEYGADVYGSMWTATFQLLCYAGHPDVTVYLYELIKDILYASLPYLKTKAVDKLGISGGDLMIDPAYAPAHLFARRLSFRCRYPFSHVDRSSRFGKVFAVAGIHVGGGSSSDMGGVKTLVTPYTEE